MKDIKIICEMCGKEIIKGEKILAFGEFTPDDYQWEQESLNIYEGFDEVIPDFDTWQIAHYWCVFKNPRDENND